MSCDTTRKRYTTYAASQIAPALGLPAEQAREALLEIAELAETRAAGRIIPTETDMTTPGRQMRLAARAADARAQEGTIACYRAMLAMEPQVAPPEHSEPDPRLGFALPSIANQHGWAALWKTVEAAQTGTALPDLAAEVLAAHHARSEGAAPLPDLLPGLPPPLGVASFADHAAISGPTSPLARQLGSPTAAAEVIGRVWAAQFRRQWSAYAAGSDIDRENAVLARALHDRLRAAGITPPPMPADTEGDSEALRRRATYAAVERVLASADRGEPIHSAMPAYILESGVLPALPDADQQLLEQRRAEPDLEQRSMALALHARRLWPGAERDALIGEALHVALAIPSGRQRRIALEHVAASAPSSAALDELLGQMASQRAVGRAREAIDALVPFLDADGLARWEQRSPRVTAPKIREALDAAIARERMYRAPHHDFTCRMCGRWMGATSVSPHVCPGPNGARLRSLAIASQARRAVHNMADGAARQALLNEASTRLDQIADQIAPDDPIRQLVARDRAWITAPQEQTSP